MKVTRSISEEDISPAGAVVSIGVFDGVHLGHRKILQRTVECARARGLEAVVCTFDPHPRAVLERCRTPRLLTTLQDKLGIFLSIGMDRTLVLPFDEWLAALSTDEFARIYLAGALRTKRVIVGYDFRLGKGRNGDEDSLRSAGERYGFDVEITPPLLKGGRPVKSTWIRDEIESGSVRTAAHLLGRYHSLYGTVETGEGRGCGLGFPTANVAVPDPNMLWPGRGVYAAFAEYGGDLYPAALNVGERPTFGKGGATGLEAHLIGTPGEMVGEEIGLHMVERIRDEHAFESAESLSAQIALDVEDVKAGINSTRASFVFTRKSTFATFNRNGESV